MTVIDKFPKPLPLQVIMSLGFVTSSFHTALKITLKSNDVPLIKRRANNKFLIKTGKY